MRIVGGDKRGRILQSPTGSGTRPTSDKTRESVFNILHHAKWLKGPLLDDALVLDVFAGTGALGLEALSWGGKNAVFIEQDRAAAAVCQQNIDALNFGDRARIFKLDVQNIAQRPEDVEPRTLVFLDPPYGKGWGEKALEVLTAKDWLVPGAVCVFEMAKKQPEEIPQGFEMLDERAYGIALIRFLEWAG